MFKYLLITLFVINSVIPTHAESSLHIQTAELNDSALNEYFSGTEINSDTIFEIQSNQEQAISDEPINEAYLLGGSLVNHKTNQALAMACINYDLTKNNLCKTIRFIHFDGVSAKYIGPAISLENYAKKNSGAKEYINEKDEKRAVHNLFKAIKHAEKIEYLQKHPDGHWWITELVGVVGSVGAIQLGGLSIITMPEFVGLFVVVGAGIAFLSYSNSNPNFYGNAKSAVTHVLLNENGWNWSINHKRISKKKMSDLVSVLKYL